VLLPIIILSNVGYNQWSLRLRIVATMSLSKRLGHLIVEDSGATRTWRPPSILLGLM
jgi:hypothetical protein